jgi:hypothetical protein
MRITSFGDFTIAWLSSVNVNLMFIMKHNVFKYNQNICFAKAWAQYF